MTTVRMLFATWCRTQEQLICTPSVVGDRNKEYQFVLSLIHVLLVLAVVYDKIGDEDGIDRTVSYQPQRQKTKNIQRQFGTSREPRLTLCHKVRSL